MCRMSFLDAGAGQENVHVVAIFDEVGDYPRYRCWVCEVGTVDSSFAAKLLYLLICCFIAFISLVGSEISKLKIQAREKTVGTWMRMISAPASAIAIAIACPIPRVPPVTTAFFPESEKSFMVASMVLVWWSDCECSPSSKSCSMR